MWVNIRCVGRWRRGTIPDIVVLKRKLHVASTTFLEHETDNTHGDTGGHLIVWDNLNG